MEEKSLTLGETLRKLREQRKLSLRKLAEKVGVSAAFLSDVELDRRNTDKLPELARALGVRLSVLEAADSRIDANWLRKNQRLVKSLSELSPEDLEAVRSLADKRRGKRSV